MREEEALEGLFPLIFLLGRAALVGMAKRRSRRGPESSESNERMQCLSARAERPFLSSLHHVHADGDGLTRAADVREGRKKKRALSAEGHS